MIEWTHSLTGLAAADHLSGTDVASRPHVRLSGRDTAGVLRACLPGRTAECPVASSAMLKHGTAYGSGSDICVEEVARHGLLSDLSIPTMLHTYLQLHA